METALSVQRLGARVLLSAAGAAGMIGGLLVLLNELRAAVRTEESLLTGAVATVGGAALIFLPRFGVRPRLAGVVTVVTVAVAGTAGGALRVVESTGGAYAYLVGRGVPFTFVRRGDTGETPTAAKAAALSHPWNRHWDAFAADLVFWALAGVLMVVVVTLVRRAFRRATR